MIEDVVSCYLCGADAPVVREAREVTRGTRTVTIDDEFYRCVSCGEEFYGGDMPDATFRRIAAAFREADI